MREIRKNIVLKGMSGFFQVLLHSGKIVTAKPRGKLKANGKIITGDYVELVPDEYSSGEYIITALNKRKNSITRPYVANIDQLVVIIGIEPKPDLYLIDKLLINCVLKGISPLLVINKEDISSSDFIDNIISQYGKLTNIILCSARTKKGIDKLVDNLRGKLNVFTGQSAVGKSTILNAINKDLNIETGELSEKVKRGKNTTRTSQIYLFEDMMIADTPGFSMLELKDIKPQDLSSYFIDFDEYRSKCRYKNCSHINTPAKDCGVIKAVEDGNLPGERYNRYVDIYNELKTAWDKKF